MIFAQALSFLSSAMAFLSPLILDNRKILGKKKNQSQPPLLRKTFKIFEESYYTTPNWFFPKLIISISLRLLSPPIILVFL